MIDKERLKLKAEKYDIFINSHQADQLDEYAALLIEWNKKFNLTSITNPDDIENKHLIDSMQLLKLPCLSGSLLDIGSGAGLPGVICSILSENIKVFLMEPTKKRAYFLETVKNTLKLSCTVLNKRAEEAARKEEREKYHLVTARAVASLPQLSEYCLPLTQLNGWFVAMKGASPEEELANSKDAIRTLGGKIEEIYPYHLPDGSGRSLILIHKVRQTPPQYPRQSARIQRAPL